MKHLLKISVLSFGLFITLQSCKKDKTTETETITDPVVITNPVSTGSMKIRFTNEVDGIPLEYGKSYTNASGEAYTVSKFNYYISNVVLTKKDDTKQSINLYQIIKHSDDTSKTMTLNGVVAGTYKSIKFMLGVDSASNRSGAHTGGLDFGYAYDMFWGWNQGYIFLKLEGTAPASTLSGNAIEYHLGGFGGTYKTQREFNMSFNTEELSIASGSTPVLNVSVNVNEMFKDPALISFAENPSVLSPGTKDAKMIADNYSDMIKFVSIKK